MSENNLIGNQNLDLITIPLGIEAHRYAREFAVEQTNPEKGKQVYLNTLAVYAVHRYLHWIDIETNLTQSESWQSGTRMLFDVADLVVPGIGKLECRPVLPNEKLVHLPVEVRQARMGYVAVQFSQQLTQVELLGFIPGDSITDLSEEIQLNELHSLDDLIGHLEQTEFKKLIALREWLEDNYSPDWRSPQELVIAFRRFKRSKSETLQPSVVRAKEINLGGDLAQRTLALVVRLTHTSTDEADILVCLYPTNESSYTDLPHNLQLTIVDEQGSDFMNAKTTRLKESLCLSFSGKFDERFGVKIAYENSCITEEFVI
ncbi:DUF1822 family protein [Capilliphycus salinus ALCB114379]|uniref:DUF1822 family protein n=1 Tax=Capilliphycus salinus TaxID=2768948 RepID=UPI0039A5E5BA